MVYSNREFPELQNKHLGNARIFANRTDLIRALEIPSGGTIAEVGVALGDFSQILLELLMPQTFVAIDLFEMHRYPMHWGTPSEILLKGMTHEDFYRQRFAALGSTVTFDKGLSHECLAAYPNNFFDLIYIDAGHDYDNVQRDASISATKIKDDGILVFNDYVLYDPFLEEEYGVVPAVNELVCATDWRVIGFALQKHMFCDIAVQRKS